MLAFLLCFYEENAIKKDRTFLVQSSVCLATEISLCSCKYELLSLILCLNNQFRCRTKILI